MEEAQARRRAYIQDKTLKMWRDIVSEKENCDKLWRAAKVNEAKACQALVSRLCAARRELLQEQWAIEEKLGIE